MDVPAIADHFLELEEDVGSCVKADGEQSDPLAFIGALPWQSVSTVPKQPCYTTLSRVVLIR